MLHGKALLDPDRFSAFAMAMGCSGFVARLSRDGGILKFDHESGELAPQSED
jgi:hypothetical protein